MPDSEPHDGEVILGQHRERYLPKNMLLAIVEELGHEYQDLLSGAATQKGESRLLLGVNCKQVKTRGPQHPGRTGFMRMLTTSKISQYQTHQSW